MTTAATTASAGAPATAPVYTASYKRLVLFLLVTAYTFSFIDRTITAILGQSIKESLHITDTQLGALGGLYFALLYTFLGLPIARLAERASRVNIIGAAVALWSVFTALCGLAGSYATLALCRFGVGIGEAGLSPPAHSLISDYFPPKQRASALSVYSFGIPLGSMLALILGGWIAQTFSWRVAFAVVGLPGLLIAASIRLFIKEPPRGHSEVEQHPLTAADVTAETHAVPQKGLGAEFAEMAAVCKILFGKWPVLNIVLGITLVSFGGYGGGQFAPPYFQRAFHLGVAQAGLIIGIASGISQSIGTLIGGPITDKMSKFGMRWYSLVPAIGVTLAYPFIVGIYSASGWLTAAAFMLVPGALSYVYLGPTFGVIQNMAPTHQRATAAAILLFFLNLIALGGGPLFTGWLIDHFAAWQWAHNATGGLIDVVGGFGSADPHAFQAACPGGKAAAGAAEAAKAACSGALVLGTRQGQIVTYLFGLWGAAHYLIGSFGIGKAMAEARAARGEA